MRVQLNSTDGIYVHIRATYPRESRFYRWMIHGLYMKGWARKTVGTAWTKKGAVRAATRIARKAGVEVQS